MKQGVLCIVLLAMLLPVMAQGGASAHPLRFMVQWFPQAQFAGYIVAVEKGLFSSAGLEVELLFSDGTQSPLDLLAEGDVDICTAWLSDAMKRRSEGESLVQVGQVLQKSSLLLVTKKSSGILHPEDMNGRCMSLWGGDFSLQPNAFLAQHNITPRIIPQSYTIEAFLAGACDISSAMYYNEYHKMMQAGLNEDELVTFRYSDYDLNFPEDGVYVNEANYQAHPGVYTKFMDIVLTGWDYARTHPEETLDLVMKYCNEYHLRTNRAHQRWMLTTILAAIDMEGTLPREVWGSLSKHDYQLVTQALLNQKIISHVPDFNEFIRGKIR